MIIQTFYNRVTQPVQSMIDVATSGTLMNKIEDEAYNLIEEMSLNDFLWSTERGQPKRVGGKLEVDALTLLSAKVDAMTQKVGSYEYECCLGMCNFRSVLLVVFDLRSGPGLDRKIDGPDR